MCASDSSNSSSQVKLLALVGAHYGIPSSPDAKDRLGSSHQRIRLSRSWKKLGHDHHLVARRRRVKLENIPQEAYPVALELENGKRFVLLIEKTLNSANRDDAYIVQFPDSRSTLIRDERIQELYDGTCVFFHPQAERRWGRYLRNFEKKWIRPIWNPALFNAFALNVFVLAIAAALTLTHQFAFGSHLDPMSSGFALLTAAVIVAGLIHLPQMRSDHAGLSIDMAFLPLHITTAISLAGWAASPFLLAALLSAFGVVYPRLGGHHRSERKPNRCIPLLATCFALASVAAVLSPIESFAENAAFCAGGLVLAAWVTNRVMSISHILPYNAVTTHARL